MILKNDSLELSYERLYKTDQNWSLFRTVAEPIGKMAVYFWWTLEQRVEMLNLKFRISNAEFLEPTNFEAFSPLCINLYLFASRFLGEYSNFVIKLYDL